MRLRRKKETTRRNVIVIPKTRTLVEEVHENEPVPVFLADDSEFGFNNGYAELEVAELGSKVTMIRISETYYGYRDDPVVATLYLDNATLMRLADALIGRSVDVGV